MDSNIGFGSRKEARAEEEPVRQLVPMKVGNATVYVERVGDSDEAQASGRIYAAAPGKDKAFEEATEVLRECVRVVGEQISDLGTEALPSQLSLEFALSLEAKGEAKILPVLLSGGARVTSGFKVTAVWGGLEGS